MQLFERKSFIHKHFYVQNTVSHDFGTKQLHYLTFNQLSVQYPLPNILVCIFKYRNFCITVPIPSVNVNILNIQIVGQPLILQCDVATVKGITSRMDIAWSNNGSKLNDKRGVNINPTIINSITDSYIIPQLSTTDENREYQCEVFIDAPLPVVATDSIILNVTGKYYCSQIITLYI